MPDFGMDPMDLEFSKFIQVATLALISMDLNERHLNLTDWKFFVFPRFFAAFERTL